MHSLSPSNAPQLPTELLVEIINLSLPHSISSDESWSEHASLLSKYSLVSRIWRKIAQAKLYERIVVRSAKAANRLCRTLSGQYSERRDLAPLCKSLRLGRTFGYDYAVADDLRFRELVKLMANVEELELRSVRDLVPWHWMRCTELRQLRLERCTLVKGMGEGPPRVTSNISHLLLAESDIFAGAFRPKAYPKLTFLSLGACNDSAGHDRQDLTKALLKDFAPQLEAFRADELSMPLVRNWKPKWKSLRAYGVRLWLPYFNDGSHYSWLNLPEKVVLEHLYFEDPVLAGRVPELNAWEAHATLVVELLEADPIAPALSSIKTIHLPGSPDSSGDNASKVRDLVSRLTKLGEEKEVEITWSEEVAEGETDEDRAVWTKDDSFLSFMKSVSGRS
ncbi:hypothetical protein BCR35DRAFT_350345 [Leucosporidium creatinivorum]|uniref:Uncharacterized protein n=1 Tax=Leucosporidium creatinivorum TaxID=106004 RepID=A0A1Y2FZ02_9BASI|nr:hypothetical protein BCR35DRAFT_350345 [Leucosporidium creatinivorum]